MGPLGLDIAPASITIGDALPPAVRHTLVSVSFLLAAPYTKYVVGRASLGAARLVLAMPLLGWCILAPFFFDAYTEILPRTSALFAYSWLGVSKILSFCFGRGPLRESMTSAQIAAVLMLPIFPKPAEALAPTGRLHDTAGSGLQLAKRWAAKLVLLGTAVFLLIQYGDDMHSVLRHYVYAFGLYAFVGFLMDGPAAVAVEALGLQLVPTFDQPWRSTSLADFWGRRWNITTSSVLRTLVYDPIVQGSLVHPSRLPASQPPATPATTLHAGAGVSPKANGHANGHSPADAPASPAAHANGHATNGHATNGHAAEGKVEAAAKGGAPARRRPSAWRRAVGLHAVFLTSGLVHEYVAWCITGSPWGWKWTLFFWVQAPLMQAEALAGRALRALRLPPPPLLTNIAVVLLLEALAHNLFFGFVESDTNIAQRVVGAVGDNYRAVLAPLMPLLGAAAPGLGAAGSGGGEL